MYLFDAALVGSEVELNRAEEKLVEMSNGCICCTLREDLLIEVQRLAGEGRFDYLVIESTGISEPLPVAETFTFADEEGRSLSQVARLDTLVTVLNTGRFDFARAEQAPGWLKEMRGEHVPETEAYGIHSFTYQARRPFHPQKLHDFFANPAIRGKLLRSKGFFWLATRPQYAGQWSQAGGMAQHGPAGLFWKAVPQSAWPDDEDQCARILEKWQEPFGDMRQELVFIGQGLEPETIIAQLDACLLTDEQLVAGQALWRSLPDPFPSWEAE